MDKGIAVSIVTQQVNAEYEYMLNHGGINWALILVAMKHGSVYELILEQVCNSNGEDISVRMLHYDEDMGFIHTERCRELSYLYLGDCKCWENPAVSHSPYTYTPLSSREAVQLLLDAPMAQVEWWAW